MIMICVPLILLIVAEFLYILYKIVWKNHKSLTIINNKIITAIIIYNEYYLINAATSNSLAFDKTSLVFYTS